MAYQIHGKPVLYSGGECGLYFSPNRIQSPEYAIMDIEGVIKSLNEMPVDKAIKAVTQLRDQAVTQAGWEYTPQNPGYPILRQTPEPSTSIDDVRGNIHNTEKFCNDVLKALRGE